MPWVDLCSKLDYASIFYTTNTSPPNVSGFDAGKPTIVILHPPFLDSTWLDLQMSDARLCNSYNVIAFDMRCAGKSICRPSGLHDSWVDAADLAFCYQKLCLPASHILALEGIAVNCSLRFAVLFPELCLSLTLVNVPPPVEPKWICNSLEELTRAVCFADDLDTFKHAVIECIEFLFGSDCDPDLRDELVAYWQEIHLTTQRPRIVETASVLINRSYLSSEVYSAVTQPVLIIHGGKNQFCPLKNAEKLVTQLVNARDGAVLYTVKGGTTMLSVIPGTASIVNKVFSSFLTRLSQHAPTTDPPVMEPENRMRVALSRLADLTGGGPKSNRRSCPLQDEFPSRLCSAHERRETSEQICQPHFFSYHHKKVQQHLICQPKCRNYLVHLSPFAAPERGQSCLTLDQMQEYIEKSFANPHRRSGSLGARGQGLDS